MKEVKPPIIAESPTMESLIKDGYAVVLRSPSPTTLDPPSWWTPSLNGNWVVEVYDHKNKNMYVGKGKALKDAMEDVGGAIKDKENDMGTIELETS